MILTKYSTNNNSDLRYSLILTAVVLLLSQLSHAEVYKTTTSEGQVVYTDNINTAYQYNKNSKSISVLDKLPTQSQVSSTTNQSTTTSNNLNNEVNNAASTATDNRLPDSLGDRLTGRLSTQSISASQQGDYVLNIVSPEAGQTLRRGSQPIEINVALTPSLKTGDRIVYQLNNQTLATIKATSYTIATTTLDPNPYTITVGVENVLGEVIAQDTRAITLISNNVLYQKKRKAIAQAQKKKANQPWYKKIL
ncbi:DUF4124 domain-containing protein [Moraxella osloensis]|uniref:DUF4124 domain-containing protein n=1 Tax=Faucicola osloensis TaxID=34062 RepID=A0AAD0AEA9_FAUOS|nr:MULTISPECIES: DUF4124 domain-containing protein [Moraxella]ATQ83139.1 DUF4124 domain-containing protein [Moraxella osloensis]ATW85635.1 DUF4124 domain-containing protein [Moraxella osloensis]